VYPRCRRKSPCQQPARSISPASSIELRLVTDRQTDRHCEVECDDLCSATAACLVNRRAVALDVVTWSVKLVPDRHIVTTHVRDRSPLRDPGTTCRYARCSSPRRRCAEIPQLRSAVIRNSVNHSQPSGVLYIGRQ